MTDEKFIPKPTRRAFVAELKAVRYFYKEDPDDDKSVKFALLPSGESASRVFMVGVIDDIKKMEKRPGYTAKFRDLTGSITIRAGEFQPAAQNQLRKIKNTPAFVAMTAKVNLYQPPMEAGKDPVYVVSLEPDDLVVVEKPYRLLWNELTLNATVDRMTDIHRSDPTESQTMALHEYSDDVRQAICDIVKKSLIHGDTTAPQGNQSAAVGESA
jgi:RPA family protein